MRFGTDTRGASIPITHAMTLGITALLMASLLVGAGIFLNDQQATAARAQLEDVAGDVVGQLNTLDRLNATGESVTATFEPSYERTAGGESYTIAIIPDTSGSPPYREGTLFVNSTALQSPVALPLRTDTRLVQDRVRGGNPTLRLCVDETVTPPDQWLTLGECS